MEENLVQILRMLERLLVVGFGGMAMYLGYMLFFHLPHQKDQEGKIDLPGMKIVFSRVGPGLFFLAFGSFIVITNLEKDIHIETVVSTDHNNSLAKQQVIKKKFAGASDLQSGGEGMKQRRVAIIENLGALNCLLKTLEVNNIEISPTERLSLHDAKIALLRPVWSEDDWGKIEELEINSESIANDELRGVWNDISVSCPLH